MGVEILPEMKCEPKAGDLVEVQVDTQRTRRALFVRMLRGFGRSAVVRMELDFGGARTGEYGKPRGIDAWTITRILERAS